MKADQMVLSTADLKAVLTAVRMVVMKAGWKVEPMVH